MISSAERPPGFSQAGHYSRPDDTIRKQREEKLENGVIAGEVACAETDIVTANGRITQLTLLQSAVLPEYRKQGIMRMLVESVKRKAMDLGYGAIFLGGNPALYGRFGFEPSCEYGIYHKDRENGETRDSWSVS